MHVDNIMAGKKYEDVQNDKLLLQEQKIKEKELKYMSQNKGGLGVINEDRFEMQSQSSIPSRAIDDIMARDVDPRRTKNQPGGPSSKINTANNSMRSGTLQNISGALSHENLQKFKSNQDYYRQQEAIIKQIPLEERFKFDKSLDQFFKTFCKSLIEEVNNGPVKRDINSFVVHYGKEHPGFVNYSEFKIKFDVQQYIKDIQSYHADRVIIEHLQRLSQAFHNQICPCYLIY